MECRTEFASCVEDCKRIFPTGDDLDLQLQYWCSVECDRDYDYCVNDDLDYQA